MSLLFTLLHVHLYLLPFMVYRTVLPSFLDRLIWFDNECFINSQADCYGLWSDRNDPGKTAVLSLFNRLRLGKHYLISL